MSCTKSLYKLFWSSPFFLISIPGYIINVTYGGELVIQNTSFTTWQYCPSQFGNYTIHVPGTNSAGEGEISVFTTITLLFNLSESKVVVSLFLYYIQ